MSRSVKEWIGKNHDQSIPPRVRMRVLERWDRLCRKCKNPIVIGTKWTCDHVKALINGGEHREFNLQPLCGPCDKIKTKRDVALKAMTAATKKFHYGLKKRKGRPMPGTKDSGWKRKMDGTWIKRS